MCTFAIPPLVAKIFCPFRTQESPSRFARVRRADTSDPALGSVTQNEATLGSSGVPNMCGAHWNSCSGFPEEASAERGRPVPMMARPMPAQPQDSSSRTIGSVTPDGSPPTISV